MIGRMEQGIMAINMFSFLFMAQKHRLNSTGWRKSFGWQFRVSIWILLVKECVWIRWRCQLALEMLACYEECAKWYSCKKAPGMRPLQEGEEHMNCSMGNIHYALLHQGSDVECSSVAISIDAHSGNAISWLCLILYLCANHRTLCLAVHFRASAGYIKDEKHLLASRNPKTSKCTIQTKYNSSEGIHYIVPRNPQLWRKKYLICSKTALKSQSSYRHRRSHQRHNWAASWYI